MHHCRLMKAGMPRRRAAGRVACGRDRRLRETVSGRMNAATDAPPAVSRQVTAAIALGTLLNPLNSSLIAVAVVAVQRAFDVGVATSTWLLSGFYLTACEGLPLMGRIADRFGPRRVYSTGLAVVFVTGVLAAVAPGFWWVLACRIVQAAGTSAAYPAGLAMIRRLAGTPKPPAAALAAISVTNASSAAFGPVLGGFLVSAAGWRAVFVVNIPLTVAGLAAALRWLPPDHGYVVTAPAGSAPYLPRHAAVEEYAPWTPAHRAPGGPLSSLDFPGVALFAVTMLAILGFLLSASTDPAWLLAAAVPLAAGALVWRELRVQTPFLDLAMLGRNRTRLAVLGGRDRRAVGHDRAAQRPEQPGPAGCAVLQRPGQPDRARPSGCSRPAGTSVRSSPRPRSGCSSNTTWLAGCAASATSRPPWRPWCWSPRCGCAVVSCPVHGCRPARPSCPRSPAPGRPRRAVRRRRRARCG